MVYSPIAAILLVLFPTRIRYASLSPPFHIGNGVFGGMAPFTAQELVQQTGDRHADLWHPIGIAVLPLVVGTLILKEHRNVRMRN